MTSHYEHIHLLTQPQQNKTNFETVLGRPIICDKNERLYGALTELTVANQIESTFVGPDNNGVAPKISVCVPFISKTFYNVTIPVGRYNSETICRTMNRKMKETVGEKFTPDLCNFSYNKDTDRIEARVHGEDAVANRRVTLLIFSSFGKATGFVQEYSSSYLVFGAQSTTWLPDVIPKHKTHAIAEFACPLQSAFSFFFLYADILQVQ